MPMLPHPTLRRLAAPLLLVAFAACGADEEPETPDVSNDAGGDSAPDAAPDASPDPDADASLDTEPDAPLPPLPEGELGDTPVRRLTIDQLDNVLHDLFGPELVVPPVAETDVAVSGLRAVGTGSSTWSSRGVESLETASYAIAAQVVSTPSMIAPFVTCEPDGVVDDTCTADFVRNVGRLLWRRPLADDEGARYVEVAAVAGTALDSYSAGLEYALAALLQSPSFLFRVEVGVDGVLDPYALASRLSFFLWNTAPDADLLDAAAAGDLDTEDGLRAEAERMMSDPRFRRGLRAFFTDFLELYELDHLRKDPILFEHFSTLVGPDAREETLRLAEFIAIDGDRDYRELATTRETFVNPRLASIYGVPAPVRDGFARVVLPADGGRAGILGHASFLALHGHQTSSSPTLRGAAVRKVLLCQAIPPPPVDVDTSIPEPSGETPTLRDRVAEHLENEACASCHLLMDPIGLALENFDALGRWREFDNGYPIDPSGTLDGVNFADARGLGETLAAHPDLTRCLVRTLNRYATGRLETTDERGVLRALNERFDAHGFRVQPLVLDVILSPTFRGTGGAR